MRKSCKTCIHIEYVVDNKGDINHSCGISGDSYYPLEDYCCDDYEEDKSKTKYSKPSKEEILEAIRQGVFDAFLIDTAFIREAVREGVELAFEDKDSP